MLELMPLLWFAVIGFGVFMYVFLDGFVLGIGILSRLARDEGERDVMMNSVAPVWDGNETWLVLGGAGLLAAFPPVYSAMLPALYLPLSLMLIALIFRGVAFEFRFKARRKAGWNAAFNYGSIVATFCQGLTLGAIVQGIEVRGGQYVGGSFDWLSPFSVMTGIALVAGYALLGASWLVMKAEGPLQTAAFGWCRRLLFAVIGFMALVSLWVPFLELAYAERWFSWPNIAYLAPVPVLVAAVSLGLYRAVSRRFERAPFVYSLAMFGLGYAGLAISMWPHIMPPHLTIWNAASPPESQAFLMVGVAVLVPFILFYTGYSYWVFRGKVTADAGYH
ncbi:Cytochrome bd ubiquinol oxidase, subunit II (cydB) [Salinisphaera sp. PC39]|uniref:cytochrome d ubiquinol oxidase subunit II n=1 Tax=Salinisphaera sp. PC39 TaxID=1304156 RepID=UPI003341B125